MEIYILGAGGMAKETLDIYKDLGRSKEVKGLIEENCAKENFFIHGKMVMDSNIINDLSKKSVFIGAIGSPTKKRWITELELSGFAFDKILHPSAVIGDFVNIKEGCIICPGAILTSDIDVGKHSIINTNVTIGHDSKVGNFVTISPGVNIAGNVKIGDSSLIGIGSTIDR
ncbi:MAG: acetyltransferase, partial [Methanobacterium paludis]|nr:acetyltransferase [Methanobacterium paludis]